MSEPSEVEERLVAAQAEVVVGRSHLFRALTHLELVDKEELAGQVRQLRDWSSKLRHVEQAISESYKAERAKRVQ